MKNNDIFDFTGETAPFGDEIGIVNEMSNDCKCEKGYRRFCKECKKSTPESMKDSLMKMPAKRMKSIIAFGAILFSLQELMKVL